MCVTVSLPQSLLQILQDLIPDLAQPEPQMSQQNTRRQTYRTLGVLLQESSFVGAGLAREHTCE